MEPFFIYSVTATMVSLPALLAVLALWVSRREAEAQGNECARSETYAIQILLAQTLIPFLQVPQLLRRVTTLPGRTLSLWSFVGVTLLPCLALALCVSSVILLIRHSRGYGRVALPLLSFLDLTVSAYLLLCNFAVA